MNVAAEFPSPSSPGVLLRLILAAPESDDPGSLAATLGVLPGIDLIGRAANESSVLRLYFSLSPDLIIVDLRRVTDEPARLVGLLQRVAPGAQVLALVPAHESMAGRAVRFFGAMTFSSVTELLAHVERLGRERVRARRAAGFRSASGRTTPAGTHQDDASQNHRDAQPLSGGQSE